jgi:hypothetical protein
VGVIEVLDRWVGWERRGSRGNERVSNAVKDVPLQNPSRIFIRVQQYSNVCTNFVGKVVLPTSMRTTLSD